MKRFTGTVLPFLLLAAMPLAAPAQQRSVVSFSPDPIVAPQLVGDFSRVQDPQESTEDQMSKSGMFLGIVGMLAGAAIGSGVSQSYCESADKGCTSRYAFTGALISGSVLVPVGVHIANTERRNLFTSLAVSALAGSVLYFGTRAIPGEPIQIAPFLAAPVQMVTSIKIETR